MKKKRRNVLVYIDDTVKCYTQLTIQVDEAGNEWLAPEQVDFLESAHLRARHPYPGLKSEPNNEKIEN